MMSKIRTLSGPNRDELLSAGLLRRPGDVPHAEPLEWVRQNFYARRVHHVKQLVFDAASESSCKAARQRRPTCLAAEQSRAMRRTGPGFFPGEKRRPNLHAFRTQAHAGAMFWWLIAESSHLYFYDYFQFDWRAKWKARNTDH
jgi:hypothetical protein